MNDTWGSSKRGFYGRDKKRDDESSSDGDDEDEYQEALRLQKVRARKLQASQALKGITEVGQDEAASNDEGGSDEEGSSSDDSSVGVKRKGRLGDKLFA